MPAINSVMNHWIFKIPLLIVVVMVSLSSSGNSLHAASADKRLHNESVHVLGGARTPVARWYRQVNVALVGEFTATATQKIHSVLDEISLLTGIHYQLVSPDIESVSDYADALKKSEPYDMSLCDTGVPQNCANFVIVMSSREDMSAIAESFPLRPVFQKALQRDTAYKGTDETLCFFSPGIARYTEIVSSFVYVDSALDTSMQLTCLQEEIYQSFGLFGDYSESRYFSFNNMVEPKVITPFDKRLLSSLYDLAFPQGTMASVVAQQLADYCENDC